MRNGRMIVEIFARGTAGHGIEPVLNGEAGCARASGEVKVGNNCGMNGRRNLESTVE